MLFGYTISCNDVGDILLGDDLDQIEHSHCDIYKSIYEIKFKLPPIKLPRRKYDFYSSRDGFYLTSEKVKFFCKRNNFRGIEFIPLPNCGYYWFKPNIKLKYDYQRRGDIFLDYLPECNLYKQVVGPRPICLKRKLPIKDGIYRTDLSFGHKPKSPEICMGELTMKKIKQAKLTGIHFVEIFDTYKFLPPTTLPDEFWDNF